MRILYDGYIYRLQKTGGINRYFAEIISRLPAEFRPIFYGYAPSLEQASLDPRIKCRGRFPFGRLGKPVAEFWASRFDIVHPTYYHLVEPLTWSRVRGPVILTVYDFVFRRYGHLYERSEKLLAAQKEAIERADLILCISHSTRRDLCEFHPSASAKSRVVHLAGSQLPEAPVRAPRARPYILFVGARVFYKNFPLAVRVLSLARNAGFDVDLIVAGSSWTEDEKLLLQKERVTNFVELVEAPSDAELSGLYRNALCLLYPSEYEGFGLPLLESMSLATPVLALSQSSIPEVAGSGGVLVDPFAEPAEAFAAAVGRLISDPAYRSLLAHNATEQARRFDWTRTAAETYLAYRSVANLA